MLSPSLILLLHESYDQSNFLQNLAAQIDLFSSLTKIIYREL